MAHCNVVILYRLAAGGKRLLAVWLYKHKHSLKGDIYKTLNCLYMLMGKVVGYFGMFGNYKLVAGLGNAWN